MQIGVPKEIKSAEKRVAMTPSGVRALVGHGHKVLVEKDAGLGSGFRNEEYIQAGATILENPQDIWTGADMIIKVKEPIGFELEWLRPGQIVFTYLHLAANRELTEKLLEKKVVGIAYETVQLEDGSLPLLSPMSEVAGRLSVQMGAYCLEAQNGGMGILLSGISGVRPARVTVIGGGVVGYSAAVVAVGIGAQVSILDKNPLRLRYLEDISDFRLVTIMSNPANIEEECINSHLVIGSVLIPGAKAPKLITRDIIKQMMPGSAIVDVAIDQGGCCETSHPTTHQDPTFIVDDVVHYCVANMPGAVPRTSTIALTNVTLAYALEIANKGYEKALSEDPALKRGLNILNGEVSYPAVAEAFNLPCTEVNF
jgi:alanine dehydrogenase